MPTVLFLDVGTGQPAAGTLHRKAQLMQQPTHKFLGVSFTYGIELKRRIAPKALLRCKRKVRELTRRTRGITLEQMTKELATYLRGWKGYFGFCEAPSVLRELDQWIRRRLNERTLLALRGWHKLTEEAVYCIFS